MIYQLKNRKPIINADEYFAAQSADIIGDVTIHNQVSIWFGAVLRGDLAPIIVGERSNIQDGTVVHTETDLPVVIGTGVTVGHQATLHSCTIGDNSLIGMKATLLDGCEIGKNCLIAAGSLISPGKKIPDNSFVVGFPGRIMRQMSAEEVDRNRNSAARYISFYRQCLNGGLIPQAENV